MSIFNSDKLAIKATINFQASDIINNMSAFDKKKSLRKSMRAARRALSSSQQNFASQRLSLRLAKHPFFKRAKHIGFYCASDGEISPWPLVQLALQNQKRCYLPTVISPTKMQFKNFQHQRQLVRNRFAILEPRRTCATKNIAQLDLILMPLVAFDQNGNRLGMGGGFYDRALAFKRRHPHAPPQLIGLAHALQETKTLNADAWDIPLNAIATDEKIWDVN